MKYSVSVNIGLPVEQVVDLFDSDDNLKKWQKGLIAIEHLSDDPRAQGAQTRLVYQNGKSRLEMMEEIVELDLPRSFHVVYRAPGVVNDNQNTFVSDTNGGTLWTQVNDFEMKGLWGIVGAIMPWMFKGQTRSDMNRFKAFAEESGT